MSKHTNGPWVSGFVESGWGLVSSALKNRCLVFVQEGDGGILPSKEDAKLMGAAPELLEELKRIVEFVKADGGYNSHDAEMLIAKLEGDS